MGHNPPHGLLFGERARDAGVGERLNFPSAVPLTSGIPATRKISIPDVHTPPPFFPLIHLENRILKAQNIPSTQEKAFNSTSQTLGYCGERPSLLIYKSFQNYQ